MPAHFKTHRSILEHAIPAETIPPFAHSRFVPVSGKTRFGTPVALIGMFDRGGKVVLKKFTWPAELTLTLIGGKWKGLILHHLLTGESKRFGELKRLNRGISAKILAKHLKELEFDGLITRMVTGTDKPRIVYAPTERSRSLAPVLAAIEQWGEEHLGAYGNTGVLKGAEKGLRKGFPAELPPGGIREPARANLDQEDGLSSEAPPEAAGSESRLPDIALIS